MTACLPRARRSQLFGRLIRQPVAFFDGTETAQLTSRLAADCSVISRLFSTSINVAIRNALQVVRGASGGAGGGGGGGTSGGGGAFGGGGTSGGGGAFGGGAVFVFWMVPAGRRVHQSLRCPLAPPQVGGAIYLWRLSPQMAGAAAGVGTALVAVAGSYGAFTRRAQRVYQDSLAASNGVAEEGFSLSRLVRAFGTEGATQGRYDASLRTLRRISIRQVGGLGVGLGGGGVSWAGPAPVLLQFNSIPIHYTPQGVAYALYVASNNFLYNATRLATLAVGGALALVGAATPEQLTAFCFYAEFLASALLSVCDQWGPIMEASGGAGSRAGFV